MSSYSAFSGLPLPVWAAFTPSTQGISSESVTVARYAQEGKIVHVIYAVDGTSTQTYKTFTLPVPMSSSVALGNTYGFGNILDNSTQSVNLGMFRAGWDAHAGATSTTVCSVYKDATFANWTASGSWFAQGEFFYEAA